MHRFLVPPELIQGEQVAFPDKEWRHIRQVLRLQAGDEIIVFDGIGHRFLTIIADHGGLIKMELTSTTEPALKVSLAQSLAKGEKMDFIIQKAVELGVHRIIPLATEHAVVKIDAQDTKKLERWQRISEEACKQCGRDLVPLVSPVHKLERLISDWKAKPVCFFYEAANQQEHKVSLKKVLNDWAAQNIEELLLVVGPEGGFSPAEAARAVQAGWTTCSLGPRILRTETAALTAISIAMYELADLG